VTRTYDIFERLSDDTLLWVAAIDGHEEAIVALKRWGDKRSNESAFVAIRQTRVEVVDGNTLRIPDYSGNSLFNTPRESPG